MKQMFQPWLSSSLKQPSNPIFSPLLIACMLKECILTLTLATEKQRDMYIGFKEKKKCANRGNVLYASSPLQVLLTQADSITAPFFGGLRERSGEADTGLLWVEKRRPGMGVLAAWCLHTEEQTHVPGSDPRVSGPGPRDLLVVTQTSGN